MYKLKHSNSVPIRANSIRLGLPIYEHTIPNIALVSINNMDPIHLNAFILREALLDSPEEVASLLGLKVIDLVNQPKQEAQEPIKEPTKEPKKKVVKTETISKEHKEVDEWL